MSDSQSPPLSHFFLLSRTRRKGKERKREREQGFFLLATMSSFSDDEDMVGSSDEDYGMSSDGDQSYGEVEEAPVASKV